MKDNHQTRLLKYLRENETITSLEAIKELGNTRLAASVCELRKKGYTIITTMVSVPTRYGNKTEVASYTLAE